MSSCLNMSPHSHGASHLCFVCLLFIRTNKSLSLSNFVDWETQVILFCLFNCRKISEFMDNICKFTFKTVQVGVSQIETIPSVQIFMQRLWCHEAENLKRAKYYAGPFILQ